MDINGKRLVIFGCGYVGTALALVAKAAGAQVMALTRNVSGAAGLRAAGIGVIEGDLLTHDWRGRLEGTADLAVNCLSSGSRDPAGYQRNYVEGMRRIVEWAGTGLAPSGTLLYTGSTGVYPQGGGAFVDEGAPVGGDDFRARALLEAENLLRERAGTWRWFILRLAGIYGPGRHPLLDQLGEGAVTLSGGGGHRLNLAHRDDIVSAISACLTAAPSVRDEVFNVSDGAPESKREVVRWLCGRLGRGMPSFASDTQVREVAAGPSDRIIGSAKLQRMLGWRPRYPSYREGYADLLRQL